MNSGLHLRGSVTQGILTGAAAVLTVLGAAVFLGRSPPVGTATVVPGAGGGPGGSRAPKPPSTSGVLHPEIHAVTAASPGRGGWLVLDGRESRVHRVDALGRRVLDFGRPGRGPGELDAPAAVLALGDTVLVAERTGGRLHRFNLGGEFVGTRILTPDGCLGGGVVGMARMGTVPLLLLQCLEQRRRGSYAAVYALRDSLELLTRRPLRDLQKGPVSPFRMPVLAADPNGFYLGVTTEPCLTGFDRGGDAAASACHPWTSSKPLPEAQRERLRSLARRLGSLGKRLEIPDVLPPFDRAFVADGKPVFLTVLGMDERSLDVLDGDDLRRLPIPATPFTFVGDSTVLVARERADGTWISVHRLGR